MTNQYPFCKTVGMSRSLFPFFLTALFLTVLNLQCQEESKVEHILPHSQVDDIDQLEQRIDSLRKTDSGKAMQLCEALYRLGDSLDYIPAKTKALLLKSRICLDMGKMDSALYFSQTAIQMAKSVDDLQHLARGHFLMGYVLSITKGPNEAIVDFTESYKKYRIAKDSAGMANLGNALGVMYYKLGIYDSSLFRYLDALRIAENLELTNILGKVYLNLGTLYDVMGEPGKAKSSFRKSIPYNEMANSRINVVKAIHNIGNILVQEGDYDSAWTIYNKALEINLEMNYAEGIADAYTGLGDVTDRWGDYTKAHDFFEKAKYHYESINHSEGICISHINLGRNERQLGNFSKALNDFDRALYIAREAGFLNREAESMKNICDLNALMGDYKLAYENTWELIVLRDSILNEKKQKTIADLELKYEKEKQNARILALSNENLGKEVELERKTRQRNTYLFSGLAIVLLLSFIFAYYSQRTRKNRIIAEQRIQQLEEEKKLLAARSIVEGQEEERKRIAKELHDGLGVLLSSAKMHFTSIRDKTPEALPMIEKAAKLLEQASGDVRRISHNMMPGLLTKYGLYEALEDLMEQVDDMEGIQAEVNIAGEQERLKENTEIMLYRIIQEMVNNTLKHANAKRMVLNISITPGNLEVEFTDDGKGFELEEKRKLKSLGLTSIESRIRFLNGTVDVNTSPGKGTSYSFSVPV
jgi:signal transduction histidine kinase